MCQQPCATCLGAQFYQCLTCQSSQFTLKNNLCIKQPTQIIQIICTFILVIFILPNLMRKRCVTLMRIFDSIQLVAYFKYINGFLANRQNYLYLGMRAWGDWSEGWGLFSFDSDITVPIWKIEETFINKVIRIFIVWLGIIIIMLIFGVLTTMGDPQVTLFNYICKNFPITISLGFYINVQDMALVTANAYNSSLILSPFSSKQQMIQLTVSIIFCCLLLIMFVWMYFRINFDFMKQLEKTPKKIYPHVYMFLLALDYDLFQTYELTSLPQKEKKIHRYSNLRLIEIFKKIAYSFLVINSLYTMNESLIGEIYSILGFVIFFDIVWYAALPYDVKTEKIQLILAIIGDILVIAILVIPLIYSSSLIEMILCLSLFGLGAVSMILQYVLDVYKLIPVDLYETGLSIVIEDKKLLKQLQQRKRLQQEHEKMMKQMQQRNKKLQAQLQAKKNQKKTIKDDTLQSLANNNENVSQDLINPKNNEMLYEGQDYQENTDMNSDDLAQMYKIDQQKRRKIYQFNKKAPFTYSNKVDY